VARPRPAKHTFHPRGQEEVEDEEHDPGQAFCQGQVYPPDEDASARSESEWAPAD